MSKKVLLCGLSVCLLLMIGIAIYLINGSFSKWEKLCNIKEYEGLFNSPISEITLRKTVDSAEWAVFDDDDLIEKWTDFLNKVEIKRENPISQADMEVNGGKPVVTIKTENSEFTLYLRNISGVYKFEIDGYFYALKNPDDIPFSETYDIAVERHGIKSPWGG